MCVRERESCIYVCIYIFARDKCDTEKKADIICPEYGERERKKDRERVCVCVCERERE